MNEFAIWAELRAGRAIMKVIGRLWDLIEGTPNLPVHAILTDKDGESVNNDIDARYQSHELKRSHMNSVESQHRLVGNMKKTMLRQADHLNRFGLM